MAKKKVTIFEDEYLDLLESKVEFLEFNQENPERDYDNTKEIKKIQKKIDLILASYKK